VREQVLERDRVCVICGATENLQVHHVIPARASGPTTAANLIVLCHDHHLETETEAEAEAAAEKREG
jgi:5-methylcytosine-specific restriction endonuclease McrA